LSNQFWKNEKNEKKSSVSGGLTTCILSKKKSGEEIQDLRIFPVVVANVRHTKKGENKQGLNYDNV